MKQRYNGVNPLNAGRPTDKMERKDKRTDRVGGGRKVTGRKILRTAGNKFSGRPYYYYYYY